MVYRTNRPPGELTGQTPGNGYSLLTQRDVAGLQEKHKPQHVVNQFLETGLGGGDEVTQKHTHTTFWDACVHVCV